jgi:hypothetical protein
VAGLLPVRVGDLVLLDSAFGRIERVVVAVISKPRRVVISSPAEVREARKQRRHPRGVAFRRTDVLQVLGRFEG